MEEKVFQEKPLISIITPVYNSEKYIEATLKSVKNQTYQNYELIIIDDASTDNKRNDTNLFYQLTC